jgi:Transposase
MSMVCGLDLHRGQITFDALELETGEVWRGRLWQPDRERFRRWLAHELAPRVNGGSVVVAVEGCTGWRYVVEEACAAGFEAHVAEPADTQAARGRKKHAKTDRSDARLLRELLQKGELPESWIPPEGVLEWRERVRLYKSLMDQRRVWIQRIHAELYQHGVALPESQIRSAPTRAWLAGDAVQLTAAARQRITVGYRMIDATDAEVLPLRRDLERFGRRQPACRALAEAHYGIGPLNRGGRVGRARRLPTVLALDASRAPHRLGCDRRRLGPPPGGRLSVPSGSGHAALGAVRGRQERVASHQPRPRLLPGHQASPRRQAGHHLDGPQAGTTLLSHAARHGPQPGLRDARRLSVIPDGRH